MTICPHCKKRLLTHSSPTCNWCGQEITDTNYQNQAAVSREAFFLEQAQHDALSLLRTESINIGDPLLMGPGMLPISPMLGRSQSLGMQNAPTVVTSPAVTPAFGHAYGNQEPSAAPAPADPAEPGNASDTPEEERFQKLEL